MMTERRNQRLVGYDEWLESLIRLRDHIHSDYTIIKSLRRPFIISMDKDENRAKDGLELRRDYERIYGAPAPHGDCSVLEVLIGLAKRMAWTTSKSYDEEEDTVFWFWTLIDNLELSANQERNEDILMKWMTRKFKTNGKGSPFPLHFCDKNQKNTELWYQMQSYLKENYNIL